ncbi:MAG: glycoside hydrolase family 2 protein, partial [Fimbriimonadales bacterium]
MKSVFSLLLALLAAASWAAGPRIERVLSTGWKFIRQDVAGAQAPAFDDHGWKSVTVPHTWNVEDGADGGTYYRGPGWYRLHLRIGPELAGKQSFLRFAAASLVADVYVNGKAAGHHEGGFGAFCFDVTKLLGPDDNVIAVRVDNARNVNLTPLSGDFTIYGGLYREVKLVALDPVHISPLDDAGPGVYLTPKVTDNDASVAVKTKVWNSRHIPSTVEVRARILDARGNQVGEDSKTLQIPPESGVDAAQTILIPKPHLWNGTGDPFLYRSEVELVDSGRVTDEVDQPLGLRYFSVDPEKGLFLNGKPYDMHGVNLHQGRPSVGWAATRAMQDEDYAIVHELGCTGVRMPHYQHADHEYELCDRYGILVWAELALVNQVTDSPEFYDNAKQQLRELIKQNYNHPSVLFWSMYNEPNVNRQRGDNEWRLVKELVA